MFSVGDRVVRVSPVRVSPLRKTLPPAVPIMGPIYTVSGTAIRPSNGKLYLMLDEFPTPGNDGLPWRWKASGFRKLVNDKPEAAVGTFAEWLNVKEKTDEKTDG